MWQPSEQQRAAIIGMEHFLGYRRHRRAFEDATAFQEYWQRLDRRCRARRQALATGQAVPSGPRPRRTCDPANLEALARRYLLRYRPASRRLRRYLLDHSGGDEAVCDAVLATLAHLIDDQARADELARHWQEQGVDVRRIHQRLAQRLFTATVIDASLAGITDADGSTWDEDALRRRVGRLAAQGRSRAAIRARLAASAADRDRVEAALDHLLGEGEDPMLAHALARGRRRGLSGQGLIRHLLRQGFRWSAIRAILAQEPES